MYIYIYVCVRACEILFSLYFIICYICYISYLVIPTFYFMLEYILLEDLFIRESNFAILGADDRKERQAAQQHNTARHRK
jgi:hypothetical protein